MASRFRAVETNLTADAAHSHLVLGAVETNSAAYATRDGAIAWQVVGAAPDTKEKDAAATCWNVRSGKQEK